MLHIVQDSPFSHLTLDQALSYLGEQDQLLLMGDAVIAASTANGNDALTRLAGQQLLYVSLPDLEARGLKAQCGQAVDDAGLIALVAKQGSPLTW
ncbi:sulfurtransferase complex subunit TusB [Dongshaea marina]|uniref:sulfurtransferase complex subunit TusB n=1 Tax=Dongshaea marina TaxID=2047966 RepID=UPI000D3EA36B|nr:sulfurtransferase complex subunit TusB [Dongshaea marina]